MSKPQDSGCVVSAPSIPLVSNATNSLRDVAVSRLSSCGYFALREVLCDEGDQGVLRLRGRLPSQYLRQVAQSVVLSLDGVRGVQNLIEVGELRDGESRLERAAFATMPDHVVASARSRRN
ncbi:MAG: BON domain-containing protein [Planctomycetota bacterium]|nr:BON domain-containing protein [Planctomycetota bacterium]